MFWTIVGVILFLSIGIPILLSILGGAVEVGSSIAEDNKKEREENTRLNTLVPVFKAMGYDRPVYIPSTIDRETFKKGIDEYYRVLEYVFASEPKSDNALARFHSPSTKLAETFFRFLSVDKALQIITKDIGYVVAGSGWTEYKKALEGIIGKGSLEETNKKGLSGKYKITFSNELYMEVEKSSSGYDSSDNKWSVNVFYKDKNVLFSSVTSNGASSYTFKPDEWVLDILSVAEKYQVARKLIEDKARTDSARSSIFRD